MEGFYQRILANNPDEALAQAETLLTDQPIVTYYDDVVLAGLKLAVEDQARGSIEPAGAVRMSRSMIEVVQDLRSHAAPVTDSGAEVNASSVTVACVSGHGPFDDAVTAMLVQLLVGHGGTALAIANRAVSREGIASLDPDWRRGDCGVLPGGNGSARPTTLPRAPVARAGTDGEGRVDLWPWGEATLSDVQIQRTLGADCYVGSLSAAVEAIGSLHGNGAAQQTEARRQNRLSESRREAAAMSQEQRDAIVPN